MSIRLVDDYTSIETTSDALICYNILNGINSDDRKKYCDAVRKKYKSIMFIGENVLTNRKALGSEPLGTFGCEQFSTKNLMADISAIDSVKEIKMRDNIYCYVKKQ